MNTPKSSSSSPGSPRWTSSRATSWPVRSSTPTSCERCRLMVRLDSEALARVALAAPEMDPSPDFKARLMQRAADELAAARPQELAHDTGGTTATGHARTSSASRGARAARAAAPQRRPRTWCRCGAARPGCRRWQRVLVLALVTAGAFSYENQTVATYTLSGSAPGSATVVVRRSGAAELDMRGVPDPGPGLRLRGVGHPAGPAARRGGHDDPRRRHRAAARRHPRRHRGDHQRARAASTHRPARR